MATDAFFIAFKLPNLLRRIFAEGAFSQAFVPILAEYKTQQGEEATRPSLLTSRPADPGAGRGDRARHDCRALGGLGDGAGLYRYAGKIRADLQPAAGDLSLYIADLPVFAGGRDPQYLEPFSVPAFVPTLLNVSMIISRCS
jgi:putative peptidoglycan lipid II flippase